MRLGWSVALLCGWCELVLADGMFMGAAVLDERASGRTSVASTEQKAVIVELPQGREALLLQTTYHGPAQSFAWVIPVPGLPAKEDVFLAEPAFIDELVRQTAPEVRTTITNPREGRTAGEMKMMAEGAAPGAGGPPTAEAVIVYERLKVGKFDATVLSATGAEVLTSWLQRNGYRVPDESADIFGHYVQERWYFVALKMQPAEAAAQPVLEEVDPVGIRFATDQLVYPLYISRASSRQKTGLLLMVLSRQAVRCDQLLEAKLATERAYPKGTCYATIRRELVDSGPPRLVSEYRGPGAMPYPDLYYQKDAWTPREGKAWVPKSLWATRYWTLLDREEMEDLTFSPAPEQATMRLLISRTGTIHVPLYKRIAITDATSFWFCAVTSALLYWFFGWLANRGFRLRAGGITAGVGAVTLLGLALMVAGPPGALLLLVVVPACLVGAALRDAGRQEATQPNLGRWDICRGAFVAAGAAAFGYVALLVFMPHSEFRYGPFGEGVLRLFEGRAGWPGTLSTLAILPLWVCLVIDLMARSLKGSGLRWAWIAPPLFALVILLSLSELRSHPLTELAEVAIFRPLVKGSPRLLLGWLLLVEALMALLALLALVSLLLTAPWTTPHEWRRVQPLALTLVALMLLGTLMAAGRLIAAHAGTGGYLASGTRQLDQALRSLDSMLTRFHRLNGCYPARLEDLVASASPKQGLDSSGNPVEIARPAPRDVEEKLPVDPLTGRRDTWVYEPTGSPMVDSGGYDIKVEIVPANTPRGDAAYASMMSPTGHLDGWRQSQGRYWVPGWLPRPPGDWPHREHGVPGDRGSYTKLVRTSRGVRLVAASPSVGVAEVGDETETGAFAWAPDGRRYVYAGKDERSSWVVRHTIGSQSDPKPALARPFEGGIIDLAWHPTADRWAAIVTDPAESQDRSRLYATDAAGVPQAVGPPGRYEAVEYSPSGRSLLAIVGYPPDQPQTQGRGLLRRFPLDGSKPKDLDDEIAVQPFESSPEGCLVVRAHVGADTSILLIDRQDRVREVALPVQSVVVTDTCLQPGEILVATESHRAAVGEVWSCALDSGKWHLVLQWDRLSQNMDRRWGEVVILGREGRQGPCLIAHPDGGYRVYAVQEAGKPSVEVLSKRPDEINKVDARNVPLGDRSIRVRVEGLLWPNAFQPGDLADVNLGEHPTFMPVKVEGRTRDSIEIAHQQLALYDEHPIRLPRDAYRNFRAKYRTLPR